jgi:hypothetical protein
MRIDFRRLFILILLVVISSALFFKIFDPFISYDDGHINLAIGKMISEKGSAIYTDEKILELPEQFRNFFGTGYTGLNIWDVKNATADTSYFRLPQLWYAISLDIFSNPFTAAYVFPFLAVLSVCIFYFLLDALFHWRIAALSALLLVVSFPQIWFARSPGNTEIPFQLLIFLSAYLLIYYRKLNDSYTALFASLAFCMAFITHIDASLLLAAAVPFFIIQSSKRRTIFSDGMFGYSFIVFLFYAVIFDYVTGKTYIDIYLESIPINLLAAGFFFLVVVLLFFIIPYFKKIRDKLINHFNIRSRFYYVSFLFLVTIAFIYLLVTSSFAIELRNQINRFLIADYISLPIYLIGLFSGFLILNEKKSNRLYFLLIFLVFTLFYLESLHNRNVHPWAMRRYIVATIPILFVFVVYFFDRVCKLNSKVFWMLGIFLLGTVFSISSPLVNYIELSGASGKMMQIGDNFSNDDIIINVEWRNNRLFYPMNFFQNKNVYAVSRTYKTQDKIYNDPDKLVSFVELLRVLSRRNQSTYIVNPDLKLISALLEKNINIYLERTEMITYPYWTRTIGLFTDARTSVS